MITNILIYALTYLANIVFFITGVFFVIEVVALIIGAEDYATNFLLTIIIWFLICIGLNIIVYAVAPSYKEEGEIIRPRTVVEMIYGTKEERINEEIENFKSEISNLKDEDTKKNNINSIIDNMSSEAQKEILKELVEKINSKEIMELLNN